MKIGSVAWGWTPTPEDMPSGDSLLRIADSVAALGFEFIDYLSTSASLESYFTKGEARRVGEHARAAGLFVQGLVFQSSDWNSPDAQRRAAQLRYFRKCADAACEMGAGSVSCIIPGPYGARPNRQGSPSEKKALNLPAAYVWQEDWDRFVNALGEAADIAAARGLRVAMECFPGSLCATPHAMLALLRDVGRANLGIQLDTAHLMNQRIDPETAVFMLGGARIFHVHTKDSDGMTRGNLPCGCGLVDYTAVLAALGHVGYQGHASVEVEFTDNPARYMRQALEHLRMCAMGAY